jgi:hypothetical protein
VDTSVGVVSVSDPTLLPKVGLGARWHTINMLCELDSPGEYYISRNATDAGMLYFLPPKVESQGWPKPWISFKALIGIFSQTAGPT